MDMQEVEFSVTCDLSDGLCARLVSYCMDSNIGPLSHEQQIAADIFTC